MDSAIYQLPNVNPADIANDANTVFPIDVSTDGGTTWNTYNVTSAQLITILSSFVTIPFSTQSDDCTKGTPPVVTMQNGIRQLTVNPAGVLAPVAAYKINAPAAPVVNQDIDVLFGGLVGTGTVVVTALTWPDFTWRGVPPASAKGGDCVKIRYDGTYWRVISIYHQ